MSLATRLCIAGFVLWVGGCAQPRVPYTLSSTATSADLVSTPDGSPQFCHVGDDTELGRFVIPDVPRWFFKPLPDRPYVVYLGDRGNHLLDMETGRITPIPGVSDAVPTPDGRFVSLPGISLFPLDELLNTNRQAKPTRLTADLRGDYQSPGLLHEDESSVTYRFIADREGTVARDIRVVFNTQHGPKLEVLGPKHKLCSGRLLQLPMLSKDGREFSAYDVQASATKIFRIGDDFGCTEASNLGLPTGKLSFSFDKRYVAFHLGHVEKRSARMADVPDDRMVHSVFVLDRKLQRIGRLTHNTASNAYYPAFRRDGTLVYLFKPFEESGGRFSFVHADPSRITNWVPLRWVATVCSEAKDKDCATTLALGSLWAHACGIEAERLTPRAAALYTLSLDNENCTRLVNATWPRYRASVAETLGTTPGGPELTMLASNELLKHCPDASVAE